MSQKIDYTNHRDFINYAFMSSMGELKFILKNPETKPGELAIAKEILTAIATGDWKSCEKLIDIAIGK